LVAAFLAWQREPAGAPGEEVVVEAPKRALERVRYEDKERWVELFRNAQEDGALWLRLGTKAEPPPPVRELRANEAAQKLFERFAPLRATRNLGKLDAGKLAEVGLQGSPRKLTVALASGEHAFTVAAPPGGWGSPYLQRDADGLVFLLGPSLLPELESAAQRLVDRRLHTFEPGGYDALTVTQGNASRTFLATAQGQGPVSLAPQESPEAPDEFARNWHERVWRLAPVELLGRGEEPPGGAPEVVFRVEYRKAGKALGELTLARGASGDFYARTEHTAGWARLVPGADALASEAAKVASGR
jgi:hypothetical protein